MLKTSLFFLYILVFTASCQETPSVKNTTIAIDAAPKVPNIPYGEMKLKVDDLRQKLNKEYHQAAHKNAFLDSTSNVFTTFLLDSIIPYWYGTPWTFTGHTDTPNEGEVACGYLVSTSLRHMGLSLNRFRMAQQASKLAVQTIALSADNVTFMSNVSLPDIANMDVGLYVVGLDNHVGFILRKPDETLFIHSDYVSGGVIRQCIEDAPAFRSQVYYFGKISGNRLLMKKWLIGEKVKVVMQ